MITSLFYSSLGVIADVSLKEERNSIIFNCTPETQPDMEINLIASQVDQVFE